MKARSAGDLRTNTFTATGDAFELKYFSPAASAQMRTARAAHRPEAVTRIKGLTDAEDPEENLSTINCGSASCQRRSI
jgi:hypothetical protein